MTTISQMPLKPQRVIAEIGRGKGGAVSVIRGKEVIDRPPLEGFIIYIKRPPQPKKSAALRKSVVEKEEEEVRLHRHGYSRRRYRRCGALLSEEQVLAIYLDRRKIRVIASEYGVAYGTVAHIRYGNSWKWLTADLEKWLAART